MAAPAGHTVAASGPTTANGPTARPHGIAKSETGKPLPAVFGLRGSSGCSGEA
jgi:hypothetical protein